MFLFAVKFADSTLKQMPVDTLNVSFVPDASEAVAPQLEWFAIEVKCRYEERIASSLQDKGFQVISGVAPLRPAMLTSRNSKQQVMFPGYIFSQFDVRYRMPILVTPGVHRIVGYGKIPVPVSTDEIEAIRRVLESGHQVESCRYLSVGSPVEIIDGPLRGTHGILVQQRSSCRVVLSVSLIQRSVWVEVPQQSVIPLPALPSVNRSLASCV